MTSRSPHLQRMSFLSTNFGWDPILIAISRHSSLPWNGTFTAAAEIEGWPLAAARELGDAERLSLLGQYAAHLAFLRLVGHHDTAFIAAEWCYTKKRGEDPRLIRLQQSVRSQEIGSPLDLIEEFAEHVVAPPLTTTAQSWARPDAVYAEVDRTLRLSGARSLNLRAAAAGSLLPPGLAQLRAIVEGRCRITLDDPRGLIPRVDDLRLLGIPMSLLLIGSAAASPLTPYSAFERLVTDRDLEPAAIAERLSASLSGKGAVIVHGARSFDSKSRALLQVLRSTAADAAWIEEGTNVALDGSSFLVVSPSLTRGMQLNELLESMPFASASAWLDRFVASEEYSHFLDHGIVPRSPNQSLPIDIDEPLRSCLASLAFLGDRITRSAASAMLARIGLDLTLEALATTSAVSLGKDSLRFVDESTRRSLRRSLPGETQELLARTAAEVLLGEETVAPVFELVTEWPLGEIIAMLEQKASDRQLADGAAALASLPRDLIRGSRRIALAVARHLFEGGRYLDARELAGAIDDERGTVIVAATERRCGAYAAALERLRNCESAEAAMLRAELSRLVGDASAAEAELSSPTLREATHLAARVSYERAMLLLDEGHALDLAQLPDDYLAARLRCYDALVEQRWDEAEAFASMASLRATDTPSRIDAELDKLYARFLAGRWDEARLQARTALSVIEETQGDRAAGGVLFTLAYLCAENGAWRDAERQIARLDSFYRRNADTRRLREVDLLRAHLAFCRGDFQRASTLAAAVVDSFSGDIREAAALIVDEAAWIAGEGKPLLSTGSSQCVELIARHALASSRAAIRATDELGAFGAQLFSYEQAICQSQSATLPAASSVSEQQQLYRSLRGLGRRGFAQPETIAQLERALSLEVAPALEVGGGNDELVALQRLACTPYPFADGAFRGEWLIATRNRLGRWTQHGSGGRREPDVLEKLLGSHEVLPLGEQAFLLTDDARYWSDATRRAVGSIVTSKIEHHNARRLLDQDRDAATLRTARVEGIIGESPAIRDALARLELVAARDMPVIILGESGTGKELMARAVHRASSRKRAPFTAVNCAALPENLIESELFGHVRGAFTGADRDRIGIIESTDGGTLFLDEIGELPLPAQAKLLRFLQEGEIRRVGDSATRTADVRIVAATHRRLEQWVDEGKFREDLYYRIRGGELALPALRERGSDILLLAREFLARERERHGSGADRFSDLVEDLFVSYSWPGNIRELQNTIRAAHALAGDGRFIDTQHLPERIRNVAVVRGATGTYYEELTRFRRSLIEQSLVQAGGNQNKAAQMLGMSRQALAYQIRELGVLIRKARA